MPTMMCMACEQTFTALNTGGVCPHCGEGGEIESTDPSVDDIYNDYCQLIPEYRMKVAECVGQMWMVFMHYFGNCPPLHVKFLLHEVVTEMYTNLMEFMLNNMMKGRD